MSQGLVAPEFFQRHLESKGLADRLDGEFVLPVSHAYAAAVDSRKADPETSGVRLGQFGNVSGYFSFVAVPIFLIGVLNDVFDFSESEHSSPTALAKKRARSAFGRS